jgi:hypothetical protein
VETARIHERDDGGIPHACRGWITLTDSQQSGDFALGQFTANRERFGFDALRTLTALWSSSAVIWSSCQAARSTPRSAARELFTVAGL